jgi:hypothetical protein
MTSEERPRQALYARLEEVIGDDHAATLMQYLPPSAWIAWSGTWTASTTACMTCTAP